MFRAVSDTVKFSGQFNADNVTKSSLLPGVTNWLSATKATVARMAAKPCARPVRP